MIKWKGKGKPDLPNRTRVSVRLRGEDFVVPYPQPVECWDWKHSGGTGDIVEYEVVEPATPAVTPLQTRKGMPLFSGCLMYFPDALLAVAEHSRKGNDKHNPGEPLNWSKDKSKDHADCIGRHLIDIGPEWDAVDPEFGSLHATALAWRALALLQTVLERRKGAA